MKVSSLLRNAVTSRTVLILGAGVAVWVTVLLFSGPAECVAAIGRGLGSFGFVFGLSAVSLAFRATAWKMALAVCGYAKAPLAAVLKAALSAGGSPVRLALLKKQTGIADGAGSVAADRSVSALAALIFTGAGLFFGFLFVPGAVVVRGLMLIIAVGGTGYVIIAVKRGSRKRIGLFLSLLNGLGGFPKRLLSPAVYGRLEERDRFISLFRAKNSVSFHTSLLIHLTVLAIGTLEIFAVGRAIDPYFPGPLALALAAAILALRSVSFTPAAFGLLEAAVAALLALTFGASLAPVGVAIVAVLRLKTLAWWGVSLAVCGNPAKILFGR